jgi:hypothetical protein
LQAFVKQHERTFKPTKSSYKAVYTKYSAFFGNNDHLYVNVVNAGTLSFYSATLMKGSIIVSAIVVYGFLLPQLLKSENTVMVSCRKMCKAKVECWEYNLLANCKFADLNHIYIYIEWALVVPWITRKNILLMFLVYRWRSSMLSTSKRDTAAALNFRFNLGTKQCCHLAVKR